MVILLNSLTILFVALIFFRELFKNNAMESKISKTKFSLPSSFNMNRAVILFMAVITN